MPKSEKTTCVLCGNSEQLYLFSNVSNERITCCSRCRLLKAEGDATQDLKISRASVVEDSTEKNAIEGYVDYLHAFGITSGRVLYYGPAGEKLFRRTLEARAFSVTEFTEVDFDESSARFDLVICYRTLESVERPDELLSKLNGVLREKGRLLLVTTAIDSWPAKFFAKRWLGWNAGLHHFFTTSTRQMLLEKFGFKNIITVPGKREYSLSAVAETSDRIPGRFKRQFFKSFLGAMWLLMMFELF
jgi:SAM-dependent methyltransferase